MTSKKTRPTRTDREDSLLFCCFAAEGRIIGLKVSSACQFQCVEDNARTGKQLEGQQRGNKGDY
ncbi:MAG: hypothetical protein ACU4EQ_01600 [Candidatus Nitrosoglobus sp.]